MDVNQAVIETQIAQAREVSFFVHKLYLVAACNSSRLSYVLESVVDYLKVEQREDEVWLDPTINLLLHWQVSLSTIKLLFSLGLLNLRQCFALYLKHK